MPKHGVLTKFERTLLALVVLLTLAVGGLVIWDSRESAPAAEPTDDARTATNVGRCIQAQMVLYHDSRGKAAEACLASLEKDGPEAFDRIWTHYRTEAGSW